MKRLTNMVLGLLMAVSGTYAATIDLATKTVAGEVITLANGDVLTGTASVRVQVKIAGGASITLEGVTLPGDSEGGHPGIECLGNATITLKGLNKVKAYGAGFSGVFVPFGSSLTIEESTAVRYGALEATGTNYGAGIGGDLNRSCGNIYIHGGTINAYGYNAAGIGAGKDHDCNQINISGGQINAYAMGTGSVNLAAAIGGTNGSVGNIWIDKNVSSLFAGTQSPATGICSIGKGAGGTSYQVNVFGIDYGTDGLTKNPYDGYEVYTEFANRILTYKYGMGWKNSTATVEFYDPDAVTRLGNYYGSIDTVKIDPSMQYANLTSMRYFFYGGETNTAPYEIHNLGSLKAIEGMQNLNTSNVTSMFAMCAYCSNLKEIDLSGLDLSSIQNAKAMFVNCSKLEKIYCMTDMSALSGLTTSDRMFEGCSNLKGWNGTAYDNAAPRDKTYARLDGGTAAPGYFSDHCDAPTGLNVMNDITETSATLYWTPNGADQWVVLGYEKENMFNYWLDTVSSPIFEKTGLEPGTTYLVTVHSLCTPVCMSKGSEAIEFSTLAACPEPTTFQNFPALSSSTSIAIGIEAEGSTAFNLQWKKRNSTEDWSIGSTSNGEALITGLEPNTEYQICAATACGNGTTSSFICLIITTAMPEDKTALAAELEEANALYNYGLANDVTAEELADLHAAIEAMTAVMGNEHASQTQINDAYVLGSTEFIKAANEIIVPKIQTLTNESYASIAQEGDREECLELIYNALDVVYGVTWDFGKTVAQNAALIEAAIGYNSYLQLKSDMEDCREQEQGIEDVQSDNVQCHKVLKDGSLFIKRGARVYNVLGTIVK